MTKPRFRFTSISPSASKNHFCTRIILIFALLFLGLFRHLFPERQMDYTGARALADHLFAIGLLAAVLLLSAGIGLKLIRWFRIYPAGHLETIVFATPLGLGFFAYGILALGLLGFLEAQYFALWFVVLWLWSSREWGGLALLGMDRLKKVIPAVKRSPVGKKLLLLAFFLILFFTILQALTPPWDYDGLMYHLQAPRQFLDMGRILPLPDNWGANGPLTTEMIYLFGLRFGSDTFAKLLHLSYAILLVTATFTFGRRFLGDRGGWIAAAILVGTPIFPVWASLAYADMAWALYEFLSVYALMVWLITKRREWLLIAALVTGFALGSKYIALGSAGVFGLVVLWGSRKQSLKDISRNVTIFGGVALLVGSPWYLKNWLWTGNPVYPLYFGGLAWPEERVRLLMTYLYSFGTGHRISDYLLLPWNVYIRNESFSTFLGSIEIPSLLYPMLLLFPFLRHKKSLYYLAAILLLRFVIWAAGSHQIRFLLPVFPGLCILTTSLLIGIEAKYPNRGEILTAGLIGGVVASSLLYSVIFLNTVQPFNVVRGRESKMHFLSRRLADYRAVSYIQVSLSPAARVQFLWDGRGYYCDERCLPDTDHGKWTLQATAANYDPYLLSSKLRQAGISHLLFSVEDLDFILQHDPSGAHYKAATFFLNKFREICAEQVYRDDNNEIYRITCQ